MSERHICLVRSSAKIALVILCKSQLVVLFQNFIYLFIYLFILYFPFVCLVLCVLRWVIFNDRKVAQSEAPPKDLGYLYLYKRIDS